MLRKIRNVLLTVVSGMLFWLMMFMSAAFGAVTGVLLMVDWIHYIWTDRRIPWIQTFTDGWADLFDHPFGDKF